MAAAAAAATSKPAPAAAPPALPLWLQLVLAGASNCAAACVTNPVDVIKVRLQIDGELAAASTKHYRGWLRGLSLIVAEEGVAGLYRGLSASLLREGSYSAMRLGLYEPLKGVFHASGADAPWYTKFAAGAASGMIGASLTNPVDMVKIRLQANNAAAWRRSAGGSTASVSGSPPMGVIGQFRHIYVHEGGLPALWQGVGPNVQRAALLTAAQIGVYDTVKSALKGGGVLQEGFALHCAASIAAGLASALATAPVDAAKTRLMNQRARLAASGGAVAPGTVLYTSMADCFAKTVAAEGLAGLYKGFWPQWGRLAPHTIITFLVYERLRAAIGMRPM